MLGYWGRTVNLQNLREEFSLSLKGVTLKTVMTISSKLGFKTRPLKVSTKQLDHLSLPCILHWDMTHFVVLKAVDKKKIVIHDPAIGRTTIDRSDVGKHFTGVVLELKPGDAFCAGRTWAHFNWSQVTGKIFNLGAGISRLFVLGLLFQLCGLASPLFLKWTIDTYVQNRDGSEMLRMVAGFSLLVFAQSLIYGARSWHTCLLSVDFGFQWLQNTFSHLLKLPTDFFEKRHLGDIISRFGSIKKIQNTITTQFVEAILDGLLAIGTLTCMLYYSLNLTLIPLASVTIYLGARLVLYRASYFLTKKQLIHSAKQNLYFLESIRSVATIQLFNKVDDRVSGWANLLARQMNSEILVARVDVAQQTFKMFIFNMDRVILIWFCAVHVSNGSLSLGSFLAYMSYKENFTLRIGSLVDKLFEFNMLKLYSERLSDISLAKPVIQSGRLTESKLLDSTIELRNVSFRYSDSDPWILRNVNLFVGKGDYLAITGVSGSGKTTLLKIILGILTPSEGQMLVGGEDLADVGLETYRNSIGTVMQNDSLFSGTIAENVSFFDPNPSRKRIEDACIKAAIHGDVVAMPMGYLSSVGDSGAGISGGEKQRLLLARALYRAPTILILDEATSALDAGNERLVNHAIFSLGLTRIIVAHRRETIETANRLVVVDNGRLMETKKLAVTCL